ncbi:MdtA/MuxA family multidrug efflux RND transporter periplasmic adaptor subunit [Yersinia kristensenii]|uniref:MdtA/MuxA family multidrug efflux RND transporter periplasmic adaptor subunit n=1 Tax=Yersinia kristensenii TaxID=28152 RepID=UPI0005E0F0E0|nr:MdtA/MuxA family multidrug efflux RND transporter periplasmic adaptor subunit [Yersinia kristensenii]MDA5471742.1 MdtA/MuxA family multidrug efflux RND transporter periplasmic adaptor subunit [Yersinia kristensenii]MDA5506639.1 MdtA/MuxA family multidrug efflux RND transporter periplasmic adaptor subunit [Yersinia kristensenii]NIK96762.1 MdtA/MuxA family multidrug efflux RND transporter periplasmic adaptor subunit [Yersinia kristensenii]NIL07311.1 MdtA/MuxA family multidrug efflux RND transp
MKAQTKRTSRLLTLLGIVVAIIVAMFVWRHFSAAPQNSAPGAQQHGGGSSPARAGGRRNMPMSPVQAATATEQTVPRYLTGLGTVIAANTVTVTSRVDGQLMAIHFTEGQQVNAGDLLVEIDPRPYQVQLTQAQGQLAKDQATLDNARRDLARYQKLAKTGLISQQDLDTQASLVRQSEGSVKADQGAIDSAQLQLTYSRITAPISGKVGLKQVDVGNYITSGTATPIVVITQTHPVDVVFTLPESDIPAIMQAQKNAAKNKTTVPVEAWDRTNKQMLAQGYLLSIDNQIDTTTGTIKLKARFANEDDVLFPNQFVNARIKVDLLQNAVVVPTAAVQMGNEGSFVWTLNDENKVSKHLVTTGIQDSKQVVISAGLDAGQRVVTDGIDRLTEGLQVEVVTPRSADAAQTDAAEKSATPEKGTHRRGGKPAADAPAGTAPAAEKS